VKDLFDTAGLITTYGSAIFRDHVPERTAEAVQRLQAAGWANVGKTNLHEFAYGVTSQNPHFGDVPNPIALGRVAGGSSGGSAAALAAGLCEAALGSDSGGSIRIPAACCGIVGFKPSHGLVPDDGCFPLAPSFDHVGPMAASVSVCTELMRALAPNRDWNAPIDSLAGVEVGVAWIDAADALVAQRVGEAAEALPRRRRIDVPLVEGIAPVFMREAAETHRELWAEHRDAYGANVAAKLERCFAVTDAEYASALRARDRYRDATQAIFTEVDLLLTPTLAFVAPPAEADDLEIRDAVIRFTYPFNAIGAPALALPCGPAELGLPASLQLAGPPGADALVLAVGELLERRLRGLR
jgi:aspartyl-tRNA(Asn)/glutamyl-tRNA(Gln) amidotransferase subunit A